MLQLFRNLFTKLSVSQADRVWYGAFFTSTAVHVTVITIFAFIWLMPESRNNAEMFISSQWEDDEEKELFEEITETIALIPKEANSSSGGQPKKLASLVKADRTLRAPLYQTKTTSLFVEDAFDKVPITFMSQEVGEAPKTGEAKTEGNGEGQGAGNGKGDGKGTPFFGVKAEGRRFVYVVDCSRSMNHPHDGPEKTRFKRLKLELFNSIAKLNPQMQFFVIFFSNETLPMPARGLQFATPHNKNVCFKWFVNLQATGQTDPREAMKLALKLRPDVIYFLTDGSFGPKVQYGLKKITQKQIAIHTYAFGNPSGESVMKSIAKRNNGKYTFVP